MPVSSFGTEGRWIGNFRLRVLADDKLLADKAVCTLGRFEIEEIDLSAYRGKTIRLRVEVHQEGEYHWERAYFGRIEIE